MTAAWAGARPDHQSAPTLDLPSARAKAAQLVALDGSGAPVSDPQLLRLERWLRREARLLDSEDYAAWLDLLADDLYYWMPLRQNLHRRNPRPELDPAAMAFFDDRKRDIVQRIARIASGLVWGEDPPTRHVYGISNVEVFETAQPDAYEVHSVFVQVRNRGERDEMVLHGRRRDLWRSRLESEGGGFELAARLILVSQSVLLVRNLSAFF